METGKVVDERKDGIDAILLEVKKTEKEVVKFPEVDTFMNLTWSFTNRNKIKILKKSLKKK